MNSLPDFASGGAMQLAMREWRDLRAWRVPLSALGFGVLLAVMGPFGSQAALGPLGRLVFWIAIAVAGFAAAAAAGRLLPGTARGAPTIRRLLAVAAVSAIPMTFFVAWAMGVVRPGRTFSAPQLLGLFPYVMLVQLIVARILTPGEAAAVPTPSEQPARYPPEFLAKLPAALREDIIALEAEDHYLRVHSLHGTALVLMRLADAAAMIDSRLGLRVHRSWWVAKDGVRGLERTAGRAIVRLRDGTAVPVSRSHWAAAREALVD